MYAKCRPVLISEMLIEDAVRITIEKRQETSWEAGYTANLYFGQFCSRQLFCCVDNVLNRGPHFAMLVVAVAIRLTRCLHKCNIINNQYVLHLSVIVFAWSFTSSYGSLSCTNYQYSFYWKTDKCWCRSKN